MRAIPVLPRTASLLLQHIAAYADLLGQELVRSRTIFRSRLGGMLLLASALAGATAMICVAVIAANWDTPRRMTAIYALLALFLGLAVVVASYLRHQQLRQPPAFARLRQEWQLDRQLLSTLLSGEVDPQQQAETETNEHGR